MKKLSAALASAVFLLGLGAAYAQSTIEAPAGSGRRYQGVIGIDPNNGNPVASTTQGTVTNSTDVSCAATTLCTLSSAASRKYLSIINTSASGSCRIGYGITPTATRGDPLNSAVAANGQGGTRTFETNFVPTGAVQAICTAASTLAVLEGN